MEFKLKKFGELTTDELYKILKLRSEIFVVEQDCVYQDCDNKDYVAYHLFQEEYGDIKGYLRILSRGISYEEASIGRVLVKQEYRRKGLSTKLIKEAIKFIMDELKEDKIRISAQVYAKSLYEGVGFKVVSEEYLEDGIPHVEMLYQIKE